MRLRWLLALPYLQQLGRALRPLLRSLPLRLRCCLCPPLLGPSLLLLLLLRCYLRLCWKSATILLLNCVLGMPCLLLIPLLHCLLEGGLR